MTWWSEPLRAKPCSSQQLPAHVLPQQAFGLRPATTSGRGLQICLHCAAHCVEQESYGAPHQTLREAHGSCRLKLCGEPGCRLRVKSV
jgi:hypothetical protein